jgi:hypothetical protein
MYRRRKIQLVARKQSRGTLRVTWNQGHRPLATDGGAIRARKLLVPLWGRLVRHYAPRRPSAI